MGKPGKFNPYTTQGWFMEAVQFARHKLQAFHWDLAFPEVFCDETGTGRGRVRCGHRQPAV